VFFLDLLFKKYKIQLKHTKIEWVSIFGHKFENILLGERFLSVVAFILSFTTGQIP